MIYSIIWCTTKVTITPSLHQFMTNHATAGTDSCFFTEPPAIRVTQYTLHTKLVRINFRHSLNNFINILYLFFYILMIITISLFVNPYYLTSWILHLSLTLLLTCISRGPWEWPLEGWKKSQWHGVHIVKLIIIIMYICWYLFPVAILVHGYEQDKRTID